MRNRTNLNTVVQQCVGMRETELVSNPLRPQTSSRQPLRRKRNTRGSRISSRSIRKARSNTTSNQLKIRDTLVRRSVRRNTNKGTSVMSEHPRDRFINRQLGLARTRRTQGVHARLTRRKKDRQGHILIAVINHRRRIVALPRTIPNVPARIAEKPERPRPLHPRYPQRHRVPATRAERDRSDAVFAGRVRSIVRVDYTLLVQMEVDNSWKGVDEAEIVIRTADNSAACGFPFERGRSYLVYAHADQDGALHAGICSRTARLSDAQADIEALGVGESVARRGGCGGPSNIAALQSLLFLGIGLMLVRRRKATRR